MTAYRVTLLDCDVCGEVFDSGFWGVSATFAEVRTRARAVGWESRGGRDSCPRHREGATGAGLLSMSDLSRAPEGIPL